jgi:hypothetical protein
MVPAETMEKMWQDFARLVLPDAPPDVRESMKSVYYAGALSMFTWLMEYLEPGEEPTESDLDKVSVIKAELDAHFTEKFREES